MHGFLKKIKPNRVFIPLYKQKDSNSKFCPIERMILIERKRPPLQSLLHFPEGQAGASRAPKSDTAALAADLFP